MPEFQENNALIWTLPLDRVDRRMEAPGDDSLMDRLARVLPDEEIERSRLFRMENSRREYIAAHALCRIMLSQYSPVPAADWRFKTGPHGRPEITGDGEASGLRFNISHTRGLVSVAVTREYDIGVDVEWLGRRNSLDDIARAKFSKPEVARLDEMAASEKVRGFFSFWTLKEAYIKAIGKGLAEPLDGFAFTLDPPRIEFLAGQDKPQNWCVDLFDPLPDYLCALAVNCGPGLNIAHKSVHINTLAQAIM